MSIWISRPDFSKARRRNLSSSGSSSTRRILGSSCVSVEDLEGNGRTDFGTTTTGAAWRCLMKERCAPDEAAIKTVPLRADQAWPAWVDY
jgi:hypothetical protein